MCHFRFAASAVAVFVVGALNISLLTAQAPKEATNSTEKAPKKELAWRIVSVGETAVPEEWEENRFVLKSDGTVVGPMTESSELHGFEKNKVNTKDNGTYKVTTTVTDAKSNCHYISEKDFVTVVFEYSWTSATSSGSGGATLKMKRRTILTLPSSVRDGLSKQATGKIQQIMFVSSPRGDSQFPDKEANLTGTLEMKLKNTKPSPESFQELQKIKTLPIVIEQIP